MILTLDLGTTRTKAVVWDETGAVAAGDARLTTRHPVPGYAEQDPASWWASVVEACGAARAAGGEAFGAVEAVGFSAARQTFVPVTSSGSPLGPALLWSDRRAPSSPADPGGMAAKVAWLHAHEPARMASARWLLSPRDLVVWRLSGAVVTDSTLASATGLSPDGPAAASLPPIVGPATVVGTVSAAPAVELGLRPSTPVVVGAGDRPCEALATAASAARPMVAWGTTANVSVPVAVRPPCPPEGLTVTRGALEGWLLEGGLAAAGSMLAWLSGVTGMSVDALAAAASESPPGASGVAALAWLGGARAPWWREGTAASFFGLAPSHTAGDLARAVFEAVAYDVARCIEAAGSAPEALALAAGSALSPWVPIITAVAGVPGIRRASPDAASAGAAMVTARAIGHDIDADTINPVTGVVEPAPGAVAAYAALRAVSDAAAAAGLSFAGVTRW